MAFESTTDVSFELEKPNRTLSSSSFVPKYFMLFMSDISALFSTPARIAAILEVIK